MAYTLDVPESGRYAIRARATYDVVLAVYEGETLVGCNDDHDEASVARLVVALETGRQYTVVVDGWGGAEGQYVLAVDHRPDERLPVGPTPPSGEDPPTEDTAAVAARCESAPILGAGETDGILIPTDAHAVVSCGAGGRGPEAIYRLVLDGPVELGVEVTSEVDTIVELRRGCTDGHEVLACVDDTPDARHSGFRQVVEPGTYFLVVDSYSPDAGGAFHIEVWMAPQDVVADGAEEPEEESTP